MIRLGGAVLESQDGFDDPGESGYNQPGRQNERK
jgi:hypothetical protein